MGEPRGILPTYVTNDRLVLCKTASVIRNAYEIRLALYLATNSNRTFVLTIPRDSAVDPQLESLISQHGGRVTREDVLNYSVFFGALSAEGEELDGWVLGDNERWDAIVRSLPPDRLRLGVTFSGAELDALEKEINAAGLSGMNIDGEPLPQAILHLIALAKEEKGLVFVQ